jgi:dethiobiotin synthetase
MSTTLNGTLSGDVNDHGVEWLSDVSVHDVCRIRKDLNHDLLVRGLFCLYGSWNKDLTRAEGLLREWNPVIRPGRRYMAGMVQVDESEASMEAFLGDNDCSFYLGCNPAPDALPAILVLVQDKAKTQSCVKILTDVAPMEIIQGKPRVMDKIKATFNSLFLCGGTTAANERKRKFEETAGQKGALRIFVAGDRANVGKTSTCLGLLGSLISMGYDASDLAYIKPATQDESPQLLETFCERTGVACVALGPIVYYKGFTRAFLAGETETPQELLEKVRAAVNEVAAGRRVVLIDGVGFPAVGSICGTDNAAVAKASGYTEENAPGVLIIGPAGVGNAVDSFNLNASYFESRNVPVMGAIFNKLPLDGYYSLQNCRKQVSSYFQQYRKNVKAFGFIPVSPELTDEHALDHLSEFFRKFSASVDVYGILEAARTIQESRDIMTASENETRGHHAPVLNGSHGKISPYTRESLTTKAAKTIKVSHDDVLPRSALNQSVQLSRAEIESRAEASGAQTSC